MRLIIYEPVSADAKAFIEFWSARYTGDDDLYDSNIGQEFVEDRILALFKWKNGMKKLSRRKEKSVMTNFVARRHELNNLKDETTSALLSHFSEGGPIFRIFWLHCWQPERFPIYDQHVHRAMRFIKAGVKEEIPEKEDEKISAYDKQYMPFHARFGAFPDRAVDKALWAFGKFIGDNNFPLEPIR